MKSGRRRWSKAGDRRLGSRVDMAIRQKNERKHRVRDEREIPRKLPAEPTGLEPQSACKEYCATSHLVYPLKHVDMLTSCPHARAPSA